MKKTNLLASYFEAEIAECKRQEFSLSADDRQDEANFARVRGNVFEIFHTVLSAVWKASGDDEETVYLCFLSKLEKIPENWHTAQALSRANHDLERTHIEQIKIGAAEEIKERFHEIWEKTV